MSTIETIADAFASVVIAALDSFYDDTAGDLLAFVAMSNETMSIVDLALSNAVLDGAVSVEDATTVGAKVNADVTAWLDAHGIAGSVQTDATDASVTA